MKNTKIALKTMQLSHTLKDDYLTKEIHIKLTYGAKCSGQYSTDSSTFQDGIRIPTFMRGQTFTDRSMRDDYKLY